MVERCIIDKNVTISANAKVGFGDDNLPNKAMPEQLNTGLTLVGQNCFVPEGLTIGRNVVIHPNSGVEEFGKRKKIASGSHIGATQR